jgi:thiol-disulfide isomerase/thioredoxin/uncharacterized membrane protein YphA (DoxX/SURF4 family)
VDVVLICVRGALAVVFIAASVGKLLDPNGSRQALRDFRVPEAWVEPGARALPLAELAVAAGLLVQPLARGAAAAAILLLAAFALGVTQALRRGEEPDCHCFGQLHSAPAGRGTIARNLALALAAAFVLWQGPGDVLDGGGARGAALVAVSALGSALAIATFTLVRDNRRLRSGAPASPTHPVLAVGTPAPDLILRDASGATLGIAGVVAPDRPTLLVFVALGCGPCDYLMPHLARWSPAVADRVKVVVVSGSSTGDGSSAGSHDWRPDFWDVENEAPVAYRVPASPAAVIVDPDGTIASSPASGYEAIEALLRVAQRRNHAAQLLANV